ncbi:hypothetical protein L1857_19150 [Amycolatopsis thermalba]|uniref:Uncharacterized protein n=2 Tax=Pseudonocardiaceae TaxID=2070 RepID=A0ABY4NXL7_9PSEU|nr:MULTISPECIES: hypothetical protein [Amycolatopsis]UQS24786.1 hypothetical protein L1857_19150 [Amycolatopsis thermalba]
MPMIEEYRKTYRDTHGGEAPPPLMIDLTYCHRDSAEALRVAYQACVSYYLACLEHYEFGGRHFEHTKGYRLRRRRQRADLGHSRRADRQARGAQGRRR